MIWPTWLPWQRRPRGIPEDLWALVLSRHIFLADRPESERTKLRQLVVEFLATKEFCGAQGLVISDEMAVTIAAQAVLPVLNLGLSWYDDFVGIVVHPDEVLARRSWADDTGVVHEYQEALAGEALDGGPITLSWRDVAAASDSADQGYNVVIHEFVHKLDQRDGIVDGCPPLPSRAEREVWAQTLAECFEAFSEAVIIADRFGGPATWLDPYAATDAGEFFATSAEAYFVNRTRFAQEFPQLLSLYDRFFRPG